jgi:ketosteroid isomerase-like protein
MTSNLDRFKAIDDAYNARDWEAYGSLLDENFSDEKQQRKAEHVRAAKEFCATFVDNRVHNDPYVVALSDREWTCTIARLTGTMTGPLPTSDGKVLEPTNRPFETSFATIARWVEGKIEEEHEFLDAAEILRQIGVREQST